MSADECKRAVVIGGSAGSIPVLSSILAGLPPNYSLPVLVCIHRMKNVPEGMKEVFASVSLNRIVEPDDKETVKAGTIYLAPSNYHMLVAPDYSFCLSTDELVNYSRPSIDLTLISAAKTYKTQLTGILLTGANKDGAEGMRSVRKNGGVTLVQDPHECTAPYMPRAALALRCVDQVLSTEQILSYMINLAK